LNFPFYCFQMNLEAGFQGKKPQKDVFKAP